MTDTDSQHVYPVNDRIEHDLSEDCWCGPDPILVETEAGDAWVHSHHSLDGREHAEEGHDKTGCPRCRYEEEQ